MKRIFLQILLGIGANETLYVNELSLDALLRLYSQVHHRRRTDEAR